MRVLICVLALVVLLSAIVTALLFYPVRLRLCRENGRFTATLGYLFIVTQLYDSAHPADQKDFTRRKFFKKIAKLKEKERQIYKRRADGTTDLRFLLSRVVFYIRLSYRLIAILGAENIHRLSIHISRFSLFLHTDSPDTTAVLSGAAQAAIPAAAEALSQISHYSERTGAITVTPLFTDGKSDCEFLVFLMLPLIYYFRLFGVTPPTDERVLHILNRHREKNARKRAAILKKRKETIHA